MIPLQLTLKNFLSYREATLDFRGLHTACICGPNGAGKSSLLEAIAWAIWGESRATTEDDIIHTGAKEAQVDFIFSNHRHIYRVLRTRQRNHNTALEFQVAQGPEGELAQGTPGLTHPFRSLTQKTLRATQQLILQHLKLDYDTFINSAYLRQGRADEFMLKRPAERKQILAELLKLHQYDQLAEQARERSRQFKAKADALEQELETIATHLQQQTVLVQEQEALESTLAQMQTQQEQEGEQLQTLKALQHQRQTWEQQLTWQQQQARNLQQDCYRLQQDLTATHHQGQELATLLAQEGTIVAGYSQFQQVQRQEEEMADRFQADQQLQAQQQQYQQQQTSRMAELQAQIQQYQAQLAALQEQEQELQPILTKAKDLDTALENLRQARAHLTHLDQIQMQVSPLLQRRQQLQSQLEHVATRLTSRLEELQTAIHQFQTQQARQPQLQQAVLEVTDRITHLEQKRSYQHQLRERGLERRSFMERLQAHQRNWEVQLAEMDQKIQLLKQEIGQGTLVVPIGGAIAAEEASPVQAPTEYPPCPLCDRPLDDHHWHLVLEKHQLRRQEILDQLWVIREQLAVSEREIQVLRQEYRDLDRELSQYGPVLERRGQLQEQLQMTTEIQASLHQITQEASRIAAQLQHGEYGAELQAELQLLDQHLAELQYDDKDHALARGEVDRWRWAEIKQAELKQAQRRLSHIHTRQPELQTQIEALQNQLLQLQTEIRAGIASFEQQREAIGYHLEHHNALRQNLRQVQVWQLRQQEWQQARQQYPQVQQRLEELTTALQARQQDLQQLTGQLEATLHQLEQTEDGTATIQQLELQMQQRRRQLDEALARLGRLQQQQQHLEALGARQTVMIAELQMAQHQYRVYQELALAFGKNGIQALMIENVLPQLEAETNQILARLSANQLHIQFVTQRASRRDQNRSAKLKAQAFKLIDTLDILIADIQGTRPYETYSGGEAFRVNFAIRLALARLLAQRYGATLQMLIVDEGFGTQDQEGCDRLIAAINAIAPDFACILAVTHMPYFKAAFQARIEVCKTAQGSQVSLVM